MLRRFIVIKVTLPFIIHALALQHHGFHKRLDGNVMRMRQVKGLDLPAGKPVALSPGGYHVMLLDLKQQLKEGDSIPITLVIENKDKTRETIDVQATVRALNASAGMKH